MRTVLKGLSREKLHKAKGDCLNRVHSDQIVFRQSDGRLGLVRGTIGAQAKLTQRGPSGLSPVRSNGSRDGQEESGPGQQ
jgi:hypothetical protein